MRSEREEESGRAPSGKGELEGRTRKKHTVTLNADPDRKLLLPTLRRVSVIW
jgi:hypothetical protein